jgi:hypothetical protein
MQGQQNIDELETSHGNLCASEWYAYDGDEFSSAHTCFVIEV